jgi:hypothetical protein
MLKAIINVRESLVIHAHLCPQTTDPPQNTHTHTLSLSLTHTHTHTPAAADAVLMARADGSEQARCRRSFSLFINVLLIKHVVLIVAHPCLIFMLSQLRMFQSPHTTAPMLRCRLILFFCARAHITGARYLAVYTSGWLLSFFVLGKMQKPRHICSQTRSIISRGYFGLTHQVSHDHELCRIYLKVHEPNTSALHVDLLHSHPL